MSNSSDQGSLVRPPDNRSAGRDDDELASLQPFGVIVRTGPPCVRGPHNSQVPITGRDTARATHDEIAVVLHGEPAFASKLTRDFAVRDDRGRREMVRLPMIDRQGVPRSVRLEYQRAADASSSSCDDRLPVQLVNMGRFAGAKPGSDDAYACRHRSLIGSARCCHRSDGWRTAEPRGGLSNHVWTTHIVRH